MQAQYKLGPPHQTRLVPLFPSVPGGILLLFAPSSELTNYFLMRTDRDQRDMTDEIQVRVGSSNSPNHLRTTRINMIHTGVASRVAEMGDMKVDIAEAEKRIKQSQDGFNACTLCMIKTFADEMLNAEPSASFKVYAGGLQPVLEYVKDGMFKAIISHENEQARSLNSAYNKVLLKVIDIHTTRANQLDEQAHQRTQLGAAFMLGTFVLALAPTVMMFIALRHMVIRPLLHAIKRIRQISAGDLTMRGESTGRNKAGHLSRHLQTMQRSLGKTMGMVRQGAEEICRGTSEISAGNTNLFSRTEQQAAATGQTVAGMEELTVTVKQNVDNAHYASKLTEDASGKAGRDGQMVFDMMKAMGNISTGLKKISEVIAVTNSIASRTNILALDVAVEATWAGEQGRRFTVVASGVRTLVNRSAQAAKEIEGLISESIRLIDQGSGEVVVASDTVADIVDTVRRVAGIMLEVAMASDEQSRDIVQVNQAISEMDRVTQQNALLVGGASTTAVSLKKQAARLTGAVGTFRLTGISVIKHALVTTTPDPSRPQTATASGDNWETFQQ